jgi:hypothetical protein
VKLHGTNAAFAWNADDTHHFQSRERILSIESDNAGFCMWGQRNVDALKLTLDNTKPIWADIWHTLESVVIFGECCGGNIQSGVGLNQIPKTFVIFNITGIRGEERVELTPEQIKSVVNRTEDIKCIYDFKTWEIDIDFNAPNLSQNALVEITVSVEDECPVAKALGATPEKGPMIGEGVVYWNHETGIKFKVKGEKHSSSKVKVLKEIAAVDIERMASAKDFVETVVSENRLKQGVDKMIELGKTIDIKTVSEYIRWCVQDTFKEEKDVIVLSGFNTKEITPKIVEKAKKFFSITSTKLFDIQTDEKPFARIFESQSDRVLFPRGKTDRIFLVYFMTKRARKTVNERKSDVMINYLIPSHNVKSF